MKKELSTYDTCIGITEFDDWSYCEANKMWYEDKHEVLPHPYHKTDIAEDFLCEVKLNHDGVYGDTWDELKEDKDGWTEYIKYLFEEEHNGWDCTYMGIHFKSINQEAVIIANDYALIELDKFISKLRNDNYATQYFENAYSCKFIAWTDENNYTRFVVYSYREDYEYLKILFDITVPKNILIAKLETIINEWKQCVYKLVREHEANTNTKIKNPHFAEPINYFFPEFRTSIKKFLKNEFEYIEKQYNIKILFAIESGSRTWGMESKNSDYDIRFVFVRNKEDYLSLNKKQEVIERYYDEAYNCCEPEDALFDIVGFDLQKYMHLLAKSNPTSIEWLESKIVYYGNNNIEIKKYIEDNFNPVALVYHYISLAKNNYTKSIFSNKKVTYKKYLYAMRGIVNSLCIIKYNKIPPINFTDALKLVKDMLPNNVYDKTLEILDLKKYGLEKDTISHITLLDEFIETTIAQAPQIKERHLDIRYLDKYMQNLILNNERITTIPPRIPTERNDIIDSLKWFLIMLIIIIVLNLFH